MTVGALKSLIRLSLDGRAGLQGSHYVLIFNEIRTFVRPRRICSVSVRLNRVNQKLLKIDSPVSPTANSGYAVHAAKVRQRKGSATGRKTTATRSACSVCIIRNLLPTDLTHLGKPERRNHIPRKDGGGEGWLGLDLPSFL